MLLRPAPPASNPWTPCAKSSRQNKSTPTAPAHRLEVQGSGRVRSGQTLCSSKSAVETLAADTHKQGPGDTLLFAMNPSASAAQSQSALLDAAFGGSKNLPVENWFAAVNPKFHDPGLSGRREKNEQGCAEKWRRPPGYWILAMPGAGFGKRFITAGSWPGITRLGAAAICFMRSCARRLESESRVAESAIGTCFSKFS